MPILKESKSIAGTKRKTMVVTSKEQSDLIVLACIAYDTTKTEIITQALDAYLDQPKIELIRIICQKVEDQWSKPEMKKSNQGRLDRFLRKVCRELSKVYMDKDLLVEICTAIKTRMLFEGELWDERY